MDGIITRKSYNARDAWQDWFCKTFTITSVTPQPSETMSADRNVAVALRTPDKHPVVSLEHSSLQARATVETYSTASRSLNLTTALDHAPIPAIFEQDLNLSSPLYFSSARNVEASLGVLRLDDVHNHESVTPEDPLNITLNTDVPIKDNEHVLAYTFDGEFFLPLGSSTADNNKVVRIEYLPEPRKSSLVDAEIISDFQERGLGDSLRIFFRKVLLQPIGLAGEDTFTRLLEVTRTSGGFDVVSDTEDLNTLKVKASRAKCILLCIHGIFGFNDAKTFVQRMDENLPLASGETSVLAQYDLILCYDYENMKTSIEENARGLLEKLAALQIPKKSLDIVAHSMGGLIAREMIEHQGGSEYVNHLAMLGTPNNGSTWATIEGDVVKGVKKLNLLGRWTDVVTAFVLNNILPESSTAAITQQLATLSKRIASQADDSLEQMQEGSGFLQRLNASEDPHVPYTVIAGDTGLDLKKDARLNGLWGRLTYLRNKVLDALIFNQPNDIAVATKSIIHVATLDRDPKPVEHTVKCDHMSYFFGESLEHLVEALKVSSPKNT